ncbi:helix-turn-helix domain-containing protein [Pseudomonas chlororaphis]|uniref:helix-turn-helix domain-containing protein n=1 Tax=Pseudomonas chlororaphis TaxID=587753 RepID=UPI0009B6BC81|nr:helix-turn-helix transcriptional regulator [Pseudomonas chlororaphis]
MDNGFGKRLAHARAEKNLTQRELADAVGITWSQISRYEAGKAKPRLAVLLKLADALGTTSETLSGDAEDDNGREITLMLTDQETKEIEKFAESESLNFNDAVQRIMAMGLKMRYDKNPDMRAQLEADMPGAYEKLLKLLAKDLNE